MGRLRMDQPGRYRIQVQGCIDAIEAMSCTDFLHMYNTGEGVPAICKGILS